MIQYSFWAEHKQTTYLSVLLLVAILLGGVFYFFRIVGDDSVITAPSLDMVITAPSLSMQETQKQFKAIQDQVNAGTLSLEEAQKQRNVLSSKNTPPPGLSPEAKKYFEEMQARSGSQPIPSTPLSLSAEETANQVKAIQEQVSAGTLSLEEATVQMNTLGVFTTPSVDPPTAP